MKSILGIYNAPNSHWVGDGFRVHSLFSYQNHGKQLSPFLLLDYAGPNEFAAADKPRGVGPHPHRGFETVTIVYKGELAHQDSTGQGGIIGPGDVQWMTAGSGILHEEFHSAAFTQSGGTLEMIQLWVNLPAKYKLTPPHYQAILKQDIPVVSLPNNAGSVRVIAGEYGGHKGAAHTFSPMQVWDMQLPHGSVNEFMLPDGWSVALIVLHGSVWVNGGAVVHETQLMVLGRPGNTLAIEAGNDAQVLLLSGESIDEPIVGHGPFVMNTEQEISQAIDDFNSGRFGQM